LLVPDWVPQVPPLLGVMWAVGRSWVVLAVVSMGTHSLPLLPLALLVRLLPLDLLPENWVWLEVCLELPPPPLD
jgi:hypothetical protein